MNCVQVGGSESAARVRRVRTYDDRLRYVTVPLLQRDIGQPRNSSGVRHRHRRARDTKWQHGTLQQTVRLQLYVVQR